MLLLLHALPLASQRPIATISRTIPFPRKTLARFLAGGTAVPGARIDSPPFEAGGSSWQVSVPAAVLAS